MNDEAVVVMMFFTVRVLLVGAIAWAFPRISRKGLMFGTYLGEEHAEATRRELLRAWTRGTVVIMLVALIVGYAIAFSTARWVAGNLIGTVVLLLPFPALYVSVYRKARTLAPPEAARQAHTSAATLTVDETRGEAFAASAMAVCLVGSLGVLLHAVLALPGMPDRIPTLANLWGFGEALTDKSLAPVIWLPGINLVLSPFFAVYALLIARAKRSVRSGSEGGSTQAQNRFRVATSHFFAGTGLVMCLFLGVTSWQMVRVWLGLAESLDGRVIGGVAVLVILYMGGSLLRVMMMGQGGAHLETGSAQAPLAGGLADDARWILGIWYVDPSDPAVAVEARFGIGYTLNYGNRLAQVIVSLYLMAFLGLTALTLAAFGVV